ncbi:hypothetical protein DXG01_010291 [Tephrocybe rancida]|nr:hypothetical protein DXG01_010291 [Tephrocybe rancida]
MHATSAVAAAVVALNAAGVMAIPMGGLYARAATGTAVSASAAGTAAPGAHAAGAATTTTVTYHPRPTACKAGEKPSAERKHNSKKTPGSAEHKGATTPEAKAGVVPRAAAAAATSTAATESGAGAPATTAPATHGKKGKGQKHQGPHAATKTGADGKVTVTVYHKGTSTKCYAPTGAPGAGAKGTGASKSAHKAGHADGQAPIADKTEKPVARDLGFDDEDIYARAATAPVTSAPAATTAPTGAHAAAAGAATTTTITYNPRPTACKAGEKPSAQKHSKQHKSGAGADAAHASGTAKPAVVPRAESAAATSSAAASSAPGAPAPTAPATHGKKHKHHHPHTATKTGTDGKVTVKVYQPATSTKCYAPTGAPAAPGASGAHKADKVVGAQDAASPQKALHKSAVVERAVDLLERYFSELDELD